MSSLAISRSATSVASVDSHPKYRPDIDGLRAVAVLGVVLYHLESAWLPGGFAGVDVFFVISGYLISLILFAEHSRNDFSYRRFYVRRIRRLFPALLLVFAAVLGLGWFALLPEEYKSLGKHISSAVFFVSNFRLMGEAGYFDIASHLKPLLHLWSLAVEEQFYIVWPMLIAVAFRVRFPLIVLLLVMITLSVAFSTWSATQSATLHFYHPVSRFWELGAGCLLAWLRYNGYEWGQRVSLLQRWGSFLGLLLIALSFCFLNTTAIYPGYWALLPVVGACLCIVFSNGVASAWLGTRVMVAIGLISYPLYLWHWPIFSYLRIMDGGEPRLWLLLIGAALAVLLSILTYRYFEKPLRQNKSKAVLVLLVVSMLVVFTLGKTIRSADGFSDRESLAFVGTGIDQVTRTPSHDEACLAYLGAAEAPYYCRLTEGRTPMMAIIGDSHAHVVYPGLAEARALNGQGTLLLGNSGCPTFLGTTFGKTVSERKNCAAQIEKILALVSNDPNIDSVLLVSRGPIYITAKGFGPAEAGYSHPPIIAVHGKDKTPEQVFKAGLEDTIGYLKSAGKHAAYLLQVPEIGVHPLICLGRPLSVGERDYSQLCQVPYSVYKSRMSVYRSLVIDSAKTKSFAIFDPESVFCNEEVCSAVDNRSLRYADDNHLSVYGSQELAKLLAPWLQKPAQIGM